MSLEIQIAVIDSGLNEKLLDRKKLEIGLKWMKIMIY